MSRIHIVAATLLLLLIGIASADAAVQLYGEDFESGSLGAEWSVSSSTPDGRVAVSDTFGAPVHNGSFHLAMDTTIAGPNNLNEAILTLDLPSTGDVTFSFWHKDVNDEDTLMPSTPFIGSVFADGVAMSADGTTWHTLVSLNDSNSPNNVYTNFVIDLDQQAALAGISLGTGFQIKFQQFDNFPFNTDGRAFDDITFSVESNAVPEPGSLAVWGLLGLSAVGAGWRRQRRA